MDLSPEMNSLDANIWWAYVLKARLFLCVSKIILCPEKHYLSGLSRFNINLIFPDITLPELKWYCRREQQDVQGADRVACPPPGPQFDRQLQRRRVWRIDGTARTTFGKLLGHQLKYRFWLIYSYYKCLPDTYHLWDIVFVNLIDDETSGFCLTSKNAIAERQPPDVDRGGDVLSVEEFESSQTWK